MIIDKQLVMSDQQAVTVTANGTNVIDTGVAFRDIGRGRAMRVRLSVDVAATAGGAATVTFRLLSSAASDLSTPDVLYTTSAIGKATLVAGYVVFDMVLPSNLKRYIGVDYTVATGPLTAGNFTAAVVLDSDSNVYYKTAYTPF